MQRADDILAHPVAKEKGSFNLNFEVNTQTQTLVGIDFNHNNLDKSSWGYVAVLMRPVIFLSNDPISLPALTSSIEREHAALRGSLKPMRKALEDWKKHLYIGVRSLGPAVTPLPEGKTGVTSMWIGPAGTMPDGVDLSGFASDFHFADIFFNGCLWHGDDAKAAEYQAASPKMKAHIEKCAELRTLSAIPFIAGLRNWMTQARAAGYDL